MNLRAPLVAWLCAFGSLATASGCTHAAPPLRARSTIVATPARATDDVPDCVTDRPHATVCRGRALFERGELSATNADYKSAEHALSEALSAGYPAARVLPLLVEVCRRAGRQSAGVDYARPYLELHPGDYTLRYRVAELLFQLGRFDEVRSELDRVLDLAPNFGPAHFLLAVTLRDHLNDANAAAEHLAAYHRLHAHSEYRRSPELRTGSRAF